MLVTRPVLHQHFVREDGRRAVSLRVFCGRAGSSVPLAVCQRCAVYVAKLDEGGGARPRIWCRPPPRPFAVTAGATLVEGATAVSAAASAERAAALAGDATTPTLVVEPDSGALVGMLRRVDVRGRVRSWATAREIMSPAAALWEGASLHDAVVAMARKHLRAVAIVTASGAPVGVLSDVSAMSALARPR